MASAKDQVIKGDYLGPYCCSDFNNYLYINFKETKIPITKETVQDYEVISEERSKSATSAVLRAGMGAVLLGPAGLSAGVTAKNKGIYLIAIEFKSGKRSIIEIGQKYYKIFIKGMF
ncbi:MAG: hypothetical protein MSH10_03820 [Pygmaiobacter massiliensis]|nr:hypothetical protein [Pygmaiobacter massiliensis]